MGAPITECDRRAIYPLRERRRATSGGDDQELAWVRLRIGHLREQVASRGTEQDYVALVGALLESHASGRLTALEEVYALLCEAEQRHKRSVAVLEYLVLVTAQTGRGAEMDRVVRTLESIDPTSRVLTVLDRTTADSARQWYDDVDETQLRLLEETSSPDDQVADAAVRELERWTRSFPANSGYAVHHALGLVNRGRTEEARQAARDALRIEDGSFTDAFNIGQILCCSDAPAEGLEMLRKASLRAASAQERDLVARALAETDER